MATQARLLQGQSAGVLTKERNAGKDVADTLAAYPRYFRDLGTVRSTLATDVLHGATGRLLLAEDSPVQQAIAMRMLEVAGYDVDTVIDGVAAVNAVAGAPYDVILMDCRMPTLDGFQATAAIRSLKSSARFTPIIAVTACIGEENRKRCLAEGMDDYLAKPVQKEALLEKVSRVIGGSTRTANFIPDGSLIEMEDSIIDLRVIEGLRLLGDATNGGLFAQLLDEFVRETESLLIELRCALEGGDHRAVGRLAHTMKGSADQLGGRRLARTCGRLEEKCKLGHRIDGQGDANEIETEFQSFCRCLRRELAPIDDGREWSTRG
jgi:CheY-like chemotaxis protein/HPt (histidine-containing phosphotransfer) domain-containing protein